MTQEQEQNQIRAINQICSLIAGGRDARETDILKDRPLQRVEKCLELASREQGETASNPNNDAEKFRKIKQVSRKIDALGSLLVWAKLVEEQMQDRAAVAENAFFHDEYYEQTEKFKL